MNNSTQQPVKEIEIKRGLEPNQTFQQEKILEQQEQPSKHEARYMIDEGASKGSAQQQPEPEGLVNTLKKELKNKPSTRSRNLRNEKSIDKLPNMIANLS